MVQASTPLKSCPEEIDMSGLEMSWAELRDRIIKVHKPIADHFFKGVGNHLQFQDSNIAERVMLHFASMDAPALPVHDSFIVHHGYAETGEIEEIMRRAFFEVMGDHITKLDTEILSWTYRKDKDQPASATTLSVNDVLKGDDDVSAWRQRQDWWYAERHR